MVSSAVRAEFVSSTVWVIALRTLRGFAPANGSNAERSEAPETTPPIVGKSNTRTMNSSATAGPSALMTARHERQKCPTSNAVTSSINVVVSLVWTVITANSTTADGRREHNHAETFGILRIAT